MKAKKCIPNEVARLQVECGCNRADFVATIDKGDVYELSLVDDKGMPSPIGLPLFVVCKQNNAFIVSGEKAFELADALFLDK